MQIEPATKIVQAHFGRQTSLKAGQIMRTFPSQAKGIQEFVVDGLNDLSDAGQPTAQGLGPALPLAGLMRWSDDRSPLLLLPSASWPHSCKAFISDIPTVSWQARSRQTGGWMLASRKQGRGQQLVMGAGGSKAKAGHHPSRIHTEPQMKAFVPADAITPTDISLTSQPAQAASLGVSCHSGCTLEYFIEAVLGLQEVDEEQREGADGITMLSHESIELASIWQAWKHRSQVMLPIAVKRSFALKTAPIVQRAPK